MKTRVWVIGLILLAAATAVCGQVKTPPETRNAALRYWQAFAEIKDPPANQGLYEEMEKVFSGEAPWNEEKLAGVVAANDIATSIMQRATKLPDCDWGVEYSRGPQASIAFVPRAHVLARLNTLRGIREMANGHPQAAVDTWVAGIRFAQDLIKGGSLVFAMTAKAVLLREMRTLTTEVNQKHLNSAQRKQLIDKISALPSDGFDWGLAWEMDEASTEVYFTELLHSKNPAEFFESIMGEPAPKGCMPPSAQQVHAYHEYMNEVAVALRLPPAQTKERLTQLDDKARDICETIRVAIPSPARVNDERLELITARETLLRALEAK